MNRITLLFTIFILYSGCVTQIVRREIESVNQASRLNKDSQYLKAHMKNGSVFILSQWRINNLDSLLFGYGSHLDINRRLIEKKEIEDSREQFRIPFGDVALFETNDVGNSLSSGLIILTGISAVLTIMCITNPKACFGSCPTFYTYDGDSMRLEAEGFSSSVSPALEQTDIDMLYFAMPNDKVFELIMTNEALETHVVRHANIMAVPKTSTKQVFVSPQEKFWQTSELIAPSICNSPAGDITELINSYDNTEYYSETDSYNLAKKEIIELTFDNLQDNDYGLVLGARQTLLTTYLLYQQLAYMGKSVSYFYSKLETIPGMRETYVSGGIWKLLGGIEILVEDNFGNWVTVEEIIEQGPIATDVKIIPLPKTKTDNFKIKLRMNRGLWRINYLALAKIDQQTEPILIKPYMVVSNNTIDHEAKYKLTNPKLSLVTKPGDSYHMFYKIPGNASDYQYFLESKGYYMEWIRDEWVKEQNFRKLNQMFKNPSKYLKREASNYKRVESEMDRVFWESKYVKQ